MRTPLPDRPPVVILLGPTAVGKTEAALALASQFPVEILSADASLVYRGMDIGTAKPTPEERAAVPHYGIDVAAPDDPWSLGAFLQMADTVIGNLHRRGRLPLVVGGTGQYVRALTEGWEAPEQAAHPQMRAALEAWAGEIGPAELHRRLAVLDPDAAGQIDFRNLRRTVRALEVIFLTGQRFSAQRRTGQVRYRTLQLGLFRPREELYARIDARIDVMLAAGWEAEVRSLLEQYPPDAPAFAAIGYREMIQYLQGEFSLEEAVLLTRRRTRQFVRRQANWFKPTDPEIHWVQAGQPDTLARLANYVQQFLSESIT